MEIVNSLARQMQGSHHRLSRATACSSSGAILMIQGHDHEVSCAIADWATTSNPALLTKSYMGVIIRVLHTLDEVPEQPISGIPKLVPCHEHGRMACHPTRLPANFHN